jgi:hypothetical protein
MFGPLQARAVVSPSSLPCDYGSLCLHIHLAVSDAADEPSASGPRDITGSADIGRSHRRAENLSDLGG